MGLLRITRRQSAQEIRSTIDAAVAVAHSALDELSEARLTSDDLWNLVLLISLPWTYEEALREDGLMMIFADLERSVTGSRKICLWRKVSPIVHFTGFVAVKNPWVPSSSSPLHDELIAEARDSVEHNALLALFKRRIPDADIDTLVDVLSRSAAP